MANRELVEAYRLARHAQDLRFEAYAGGACADPRSEEYRRFFGTGEFRGQGVEDRVTLKGFMCQSRNVADGDVLSGELIDPVVAFRMSAGALREMADAGVAGAAEELARRAARRAVRRGLVAA